MHHYDREHVTDTALAVVALARNALAGVRESKAYANLDNWLDALMAGNLEWSGPSEPSGYAMVEDADTFIHTVSIRQRHWPRGCKSCSEEFRPDRANAKNCPTCRAAKRRKARS